MTKPSPLGAQLTWSLNESSTVNPPLSGAQTAEAYLKASKATGTGGITTSASGSTTASQTSAASSSTASGSASSTSTSSAASSSTSNNGASLPGWNGVLGALGVVISLGGITL